MRLKGSPEDDGATAEVLLDVLDEVEATTWVEDAAEDADVARVLDCELLVTFATPAAVEVVEVTDDVLNTAPQIAVLETPGIRVPLM